MRTMIRGLSRRMEFVRDLFGDKMAELKPISHKEFNAYIKGKGFKGRTTP